MTSAIGESLFTFFASLAQGYSFLISEARKKTEALNIKSALDNELTSSSFVYQIFSEQ